jgi:hypothetical protein
MSGVYGQQTGTTPPGNGSTTARSLLDVRCCDRCPSIGALLQMGIISGGSLHCWGSSRAQWWSCSRSRWESKMESFGSPLWYHPKSVLTERSSVIRTPQPIAKTVLHKSVDYLEAQASELIWKPKCSATITWKPTRDITTKDKTTKYTGPRGVCRTWERALPMSTWLKVCWGGEVQQLSTGNRLDIQLDTNQSNRNHLLLAIRTKLQGGWCLFVCSFIFFCFSCDEHWQLLGGRARVDAGLWLVDEGLVCSPLCLPWVFAKNDCYNPLKYYWIVWYSLVEQHLCTTKSTLSCVVT